MTGADFTGVDIDLLADYIGGALDGTPDEARVAALIAQEPAWRDAHALLGGAMTEVGAQLHGWGAEPEPMPADVFARLESAFADPVGAAPGKPRLELVREPAGELGAEAAAAPGLGAAASGGSAPVRNKGLDRRRWRNRWGASLAAAAAAAAIAGGGIAYLGGSGSSSDDSAGSTAAGVAAPEVAGLSAGGAITSTNRNYTAEGLQGDAVAPLSTGGGTASPPSAFLPTPSARGESSNKSMSAAGGLTDGLARLRPPAALQACLDAIGAANAAGAITVQTVEYARFDGSPALVVHFSAANGTWAWVSGPSCGLTGVGPATAYSVQVG